MTVYCGSGVTACHDLLALEWAGLGQGKLFVGSWSQWSQRPDRPVATGADPDESCRLRVPTFIPMYFMSNLLRFGSDSSPTSPDYCDR